MDTSRTATAAYVTLAVADTLLAGASGDPPGPAARWRRVTKPLLMPSLAAALVRATPGARDPLRRATLVAQGLSGVGDVALLGRGDTAFLTGLSAFLGAHLGYVSGFAAARTDSHAPIGLEGHRRTDRVPRAAAALFLVGGPAMGWAAGRTSTRLRLPVVAYAGALCAMAGTASRVDPADGST